MTTSAAVSRRFSAAAPALPRRSTATLCLPELRRSKKAVGPSRAPSGLAVDSTLITVAPADARSEPHKGPAHRLLRSTTTRSVKARGRVVPATEVRPTGVAAVNPARGSTATGRPTRTARSTSASAVEAAAAAAASPQIDVGGSASSSHAGTSAMSSARANETATQSSPTGRSRDEPPQLTSPPLCRPAMAARSPRRARGSMASVPPSRRAADRIRAATAKSPGTRSAGGPSGAAPGQPVRAMAPLSAQAARERPSPPRSSASPATARQWPFTAHACHLPLPRCALRMDRRAGPAWRRAGARGPSDGGGRPRRA